MESEKTLKLALGRVVKNLRKQANLSQGELAERADLDRTYISLLERGERSPKLPTFFAVARGLKIEPAELTALVSHELSKQ